MIQEDYLFVVIIRVLKFVVTLSSLDVKVVGCLLFDWIAIKDSGGSVNYRQVGNVIFEMPLRWTVPLMCVSGSWFSNFKNMNIICLIGINDAVSDGTTKTWVLSIERSQHKKTVSIWAWCIYELNSFFATPEFLNF